MQTILIIISSILALISPVVYGHAILTGSAKPHRTTRFVLLLITTLSTVSLFAQHNHVAIWLAGVSTIQAIFIFMLSIKYGMGGWERDDIICLMIALIGIILWKITRSPVIALYAAIAADLTGMIPAVRKTYYHPETEVWSFFLIDTVAAFCNLLAVHSSNIQQLSYPLYLVLINFAMVILIIRPQSEKENVIGEISTH